MIGVGRGSPVLFGLGFAAGLGCRWKLLLLTFVDAAGEVDGADGQRAAVAWPPLATFRKESA